MSRNPAVTKAFADCIARGSSTNVPRYDETILDYVCDATPMLALAEDELDGLIADRLPDIAYLTKARKLIDELIDLLFVTTFIKYALERGEKVGATRWDATPFGIIKATEERVHTICDTIGAFIGDFDGILGLLITCGELVDESLDAIKPAAKPIFSFLSGVGADDSDDSDTDSDTEPSAPFVGNCAKGFNTFAVLDDDDSDSDTDTRAGAGDSGLVSGLEWVCFGEDGHIEKIIRRRQLAGDSISEFLDRTRYRQISNANLREFKDTLPGKDAAKFGEFLEESVSSSEKVRETIREERRNRIVTDHIKKLREQMLGRTRSWIASDLAFGLRKHFRELNLMRKG